MTTTASARTSQRTTPATLPRAAVAAPACSFLTRGGDCGIVYQEEPYESTKEVKLEIVEKHGGDPPTLVRRKCR